MAQIIIEIPDPAVTRVLDAFAGMFGWVDVETSGPKGSFAKKEIINHIKEVVKSWEESQVEEVVRATIPPVEPVEVT